MKCKKTLRLIFALRIWNAEKYFALFLHSGSENLIIRQYNQSEYQKSSKNDGLFYDCG